MADPRLRIDQLKNPYTLEVGHRALTGENAVEGAGIDNAGRRKASAQKPLPDWQAEMIQQLRREPAGGSLHPTI